jgi:hypothetical protein
MAKRKRKLSPVEKAEKERRRREYMTIFINGKQKRVKREPTVDGIPVDEFIRINADPIWLLQNEMYEELHEWEQQQEEAQEASQPKPARDSKKAGCPDDDDLPF